MQSKYGAAQAVEDSWNGTVCVWARLQTGGK